MNFNIHIEEDKQRLRPENSEVNRLFGSNEKILSLTDWRPQFKGLNGFRSGLEITINWFLDPKNLSKYSSNYEI